jgi:MFS family permease
MSAQSRPAVIYATSLVVVAYALNLMDRMILAVLAQPIKAELGLSDAQLGLLNGFAFVAIYAAAGLPLARLADRVGRRWVLAGSLAVWSGMTAMCGLSRSYPQLAVARLGVGLGEAGGLPVGMAVIADGYPPERRALPMSLMSGGACLGIALGMSAGAAIAAEYGWRVAFMVAGLPGLLLAVVVALSLPEKPRIATPKVEGDTLWRGIKRLFARPTFRWLVAAHAGFNFVAGGMVAWLPLFMMRSHDLSLAETGALLGLAIAGGMAVGGVGGAWLFQAMGVSPSRGLKLAGLLALVGLPLFAGAILVPNAHLAVGLLLCAGAFTGVVNGPLLAGQQGVADGDDRALAAASSTFAANYVGTGLLPFLVGLSSDALTPAFGDEALRMVLLGASVVIALAAGCMIRAARTYDADATA